MYESFQDHLINEIKTIKEAGLYKTERVITSPQNTQIESNHQRVINFCANNYLGLADDPELVKTAQQALDQFGYGMSSVRFICGTQSVHKQLENSLSQFLRQEDTILYSSCFDANTGLFETLLGPEDAIISDELNHASIIDGIRLCKSHRFRYKNNDMGDLKNKLEEAKSCRFKMIATDGVFSMDGTLANLPDICQLAQEYQALVMVDDSHAVGFMGPNGRGTPEYWGVEDQIDIITGTLGKALGGASGGYTSSKREIVDWLRQRSRPYLFSNSLAPVIAATSLKALDLLKTRPELIQKVKSNAQQFRSGLQKLGFQLIEGDHPIIPIMLGEAPLAQQMSEELLKEGVYVIGFSFPVVPKGKARIRTQMSSAHTEEQIQKALLAFEKVGQKLGVIH